MKKIDTFAGMLLKYHRKQNGLEQKELCHNICVVSHLSKIENGKIKASKHILNELFSRLNLKYNNDEDFIAKYSRKIDEYFDALIYDKPRDQVFNELNEAKDDLKISPLLIPYLCIDFIHNYKEELSDLEELKDFIDIDYIAWYFYIKSLYDEDKLPYAKMAYNHMHNSFLALNLMFRYVNNGNYSQAMSLYQEIVNLAAKEGNVHSLMLVNVSAGNCASTNLNTSLMLEYYIRAKNFLWNNYHPYYSQIIDYNIGASYFELGKYQETVDYLSPLSFAEDEYGANVLTCHKLSLAYIQLNNKDKAKEIIKEGKEILKAHSLPEEYLLMLETSEMMCDDNYLDNPLYGKKLEKLMQYIKNNQSIGFYKFNKVFLEEWYCHNRRYKDALNLNKYPWIN